MFEEIRKFFSSSKDAQTAPLEPVDKVKLAAAAVLIAAARSDGVFGVEEAGATLEGLETHLGVEPEKVQALFDQASDAYQTFPFNSFLETLRTSMSDGEREAVLSIAWAVIGADGIVTEEETKFATRLRQSLGLSLEQSLRARKTAEHVSQDGFHEFVQASAEVVTDTHNKHLKGDTPGNS